MSYRYNRSDLEVTWDDETEIDDRGVAMLGAAHPLGDKVIIGTRWEAVVENVAEVFKPEHFYPLGDGHYRWPESADVLARWLWKQIESIRHHEHIIHRHRDTRWTHYNGLVLGNQVGLAIIETMINEGALRVWITPHIRTNRLEPRMRVDKLGMESWKAARLLVLDHEDH